jgi:hypothetical protein
MKIELSARNKRRIFIAILSAMVIMAVVALWGGAWYWIDANIVSSDSTIATDEAARGTFGDKFGAINALFSGLAFAGIIVTLALQRQDLAQQRVEIERTNQELIAHGVTLKRQRFESTLFHMLALHSDILDKLKISSSTNRDAFQAFNDFLKQLTPEFPVFHAVRKMTIEELHDLKSNRKIPVSAMSKLDDIEIGALEDDIDKNLIIVSKSGEADLKFHRSLIDSAYVRAHEKSKDGLSHYFRNLYSLLRFINDSTDVLEEEKPTYIRLVRAQLSDQELVALFYNCIATHNGRIAVEFGYPKMIKLADKFDLFQNINHASLFHGKHSNIFEERASAAKQI